MLNKVFISYRHESAEHARAVWRLGKLLQQANLPVELDQFYLESNPGGPDEGWPKWCEDRATRSRCVLVIGSAGWFAAYEGTSAPRKGLGAALEAQLFRQALFEQQGINSRMRVVFVDASAEGYAIPERWRTWHEFYPLQSTRDLDQLVAWIGQQLGLPAETPTVTWPAPVEFPLELADRTSEWPLITDLLAGRSSQRILLLEGKASGVGKSTLAQCAQRYAKRLGIPVARVDFRDSGLNVESMLGQLELDLGEHLPTFSREPAKSVQLLRKALRTLQRPLLLIFDTYEAAAGNTALADCLSQQILREVETALGLAVIVAGQSVPSTAGFGWGTLSKHVPLEPIIDVTHWERWVQGRYPHFTKNGVHLPTILLCTGGNPKLVSEICEIIAKATVPA